MNVLVCVKRVPAPGAMIPLTDDGKDLDTRYLGFTIGPHEECAVEEAIRIVEHLGGSSTVLTLGPPEADEQLRYAMAMGIETGAHVITGGDEWDAQSTARAMTDAIHTLEEETGPFDLILFGNETADAGNYQVGIRIATALGRPIIAGIKGIELIDGHVRIQRERPSGLERYHLPLPAAVAVKEGINLPRYPAMRGRLRAKKSTVRTFEVPPYVGGMRKVGLRHAPQETGETVILGHGPDAAPAVVNVLKELKLL